MNVLFVADTGRLIGGGEVSLLTLLRGLDRSSFTPFLACPDEGELSEACRALGIPVFLFSHARLRGPRSLFNCLKGLRRIKRIIREQGIDIVHTNSTGSIVLLCGLACGRKVPLVSHCRIFCRGLPADLWMSLFSRRVIVSSKALAGSLRLVPPDRVSVIPNGVDLSAFTNDTGYPGEGTLVGMISSAVPGKGLEMFIETAALVSEKLPECRFLLAGFEPDSAYARSVLRLVEDSGIGERFVITGKTGDIPGLMSRLAVLVFPSVIDAFGRTVIEAMAAGRPVAGFDIHALPEIIENGVTGLLVKAGDVRALADAVAGIARDRKLGAAMGQAGRRRCEKLFEAGGHCRAVEKIYEEALGDGTEKR